MSEHDKPSTGLKAVVDKAQDMVGGMVGMASASTAGSHDAGAFVANAAIGDLYEIEAARLALTRATSDGVRELAAMMIDHHMTSTHQLQSALLSREVTETLGELQPPMALDERRKGMIDNLRDAADDAFDGRYLDQQRLAHQETITLLKGYAEHGDNPQLRSVAIGALPMVERHLRRLTRAGAH